MKEKVCFFAGVALRTSLSPTLVSWTEFGCRARLGQEARTDTAAMLGELLNNLKPGWSRDFSRVEFNSRSRAHRQVERLEESSLVPRSKTSALEEAGSIANALLGMGSRPARRSAQLRHHSLPALPSLVKKKRMCSSGAEKEDTSMRARSQSASGASRLLVVKKKSSPKAHTHTHTPPLAVQNPHPSSTSRAPGSTTYYNRWQYAWLTNRSTTHTHTLGVARHRTETAHPQTGRGKAPRRPDRRPTTAASNQPSTGGSSNPSSRRLDARATCVLVDMRILSCRSQVY